MAEAMEPETVQKLEVVVVVAGPAQAVEYSLKAIVELVELAIGAAFAAVLAAVLAAVAVLEAPNEVPFMRGRFAAPAEDLPGLVHSKQLSMPPAAVGPLVSHSS